MSDLYVYEVGKMALETLISLDEPYVHSNLLHLVGSVNEFFGDNKRGTVADEKVNETIAVFKNWIKQLEAYEHELYEFCGVHDFQELNRILFGGDKNKTFGMLAQSVMADSGFLRKIIPSLTKSMVENIYTAFSKSDLTDLFEFRVDENGKKGMTFEETKEAILSGLQRYFINENKGSNRVSVSQINNILSSDLQADLKKDLDKWKKSAIVTAKSKDSHIHKFIDSVFEKTIGFNIPASLFKTEFIKTFEEKAEKQAKVYMVKQGDNLHKIASQYADLAYYWFLQGKNFVDIKNILGIVGEEMISFALLDNGLGIEISSVGQKKEIEIEEQFKKVAPKIKMTDYNLDDSGESTQSKTDNIITLIGKDGRTKIFRVQSKNYALKKLEEADENLVNPEMWRTIKMTGDSSVLTILNNLNKKTIIDEESIKTMAYYIANLTWFSKHESNDFIAGFEKGEEGVKKTRYIKDNNGTFEKGRGLGGLQEAINIMISEGIQAFIGMSLEPDTNDLNIEASNVFYFLSARTLFPVSEVLKAAIKMMENLKKEIFGIHFTLNTSSASFEYNSDAREFWQAKLDALGGEIPTLDYTKPELLAVGRKQGGEIMSSLKGHVNFNFNIGDILKQSSYLF